MATKKSIEENVTQLKYNSIFFLCWTLHGVEE